MNTSQSKVTKTLLNVATAIALLSTQAVYAKMVASVENETTSNLQTEINQNINSMLEYVQATVNKQDIDKQISTAALELQTNELVRNVDEKLPKFKFKVVIAD